MDINQPQTPRPPQSQPDNTQLMAVLSYISVLVLVPLLTDAKKNEFVKFHIKQGLILLVCEIISYFIFAIPVFGFFLVPLLNLAFLVLAIMGIMNALNKQTKELPVIGHLAQNIHI